MYELTQCLFTQNETEAFPEWKMGTYHAGVDCGLLYVAGNASHKGIPVLKVGVKIGLQKNREQGAWYNNYLINADCMATSVRLCLCLCFCMCAWNMIGGNEGFEQCWKF